VSGYGLVTFTANARMRRGQTFDISLDRVQMQVDERMVNLSPGMATTVEIKTGSRTILSYLLSPLLRYRQEVLHER
jgi:hemolysin D